MPEYNFRLLNHPSQARHPVTNHLLYDTNGEPVPKYPGRRSVALDNSIIAYVNEYGHIAFLVSREKLGPIAEAATKFVADHFKPGGKASFPVFIPPEAEDDDDDED